MWSKLRATGAQNLKLRALHPWYYLGPGGRPCKALAQIHGFPGNWTLVSGDL